MKNIERRLQGIERNITRGNLIALLGILCFIKPKDEAGKKLLKGCGLLVGVAMLLNGIVDVMDIADEEDEVLT